MSDEPTSPNEFVVEHVPDTPPLGGAEPASVAPLTPAYAPPPPPAPQYSGAVLPPKSVGVAYVLWFFFGLLGIHHFYLGKIGRGILWLLTGGLLGIGWLVDLFTLPGQVRQVNAQRAVGIG